MTLQDCRRESDKQRDLLSKGIESSNARGQAKVLAHVAADDSFDGVAREWLSKLGKWKEATRSKGVWMFET